MPTSKSSSCAVLSLTDPESHPHLDARLARRPVVLVLIRRTTRRVRRHHATAGEHFVVGDDRTSVRTWRVRVPRVESSDGRDPDRQASSLSAVVEILVVIVIVVVAAVELSGRRWRRLERRERQLRRSYDDVTFRFLVHPRLLLLLLLRGPRLGDGVLESAGCRAWRHRTRPDRRHDGTVSCIQRLHASLQRRRAVLRADRVAGVLGAVAGRRERGRRVRVCTVADTAGLARRPAVAELAARAAADTVTDCPDLVRLSTAEERTRSEDYQDTEMKNQSALWRQC